MTQSAEPTFEQIKEYCERRCMKIISNDFYYALLRSYTQPTLYGYNIEHLELIARILEIEGLPPERVKEVLTDVGRIVAIVSNEFEESLRRAVEQWAQN